jgi:hypothetical protein
LQSLDRIKCRLLEGSNAQEVRAMVLDMQARLLLDMLGKGIESALINPSALVPDPWQVSNETLSSIGLETVAVEPALIPNIEVCLFTVVNCNKTLHLLFKTLTQYSAATVVNCMVLSATGATHVKELINLHI